MAKNKLPQGWVETNIGSVGKIIHYGYTATSTKIDTGTKYLRITDIQNNNVNWSEVPFCKISEKEKPNFLLHENDIVFARTGGTVGKSFLIKKNVPSAIFASYLIRVVLTEYTNPKFIHLFFQSGNYWHQIQQNKTGLKTNVNAQILSKLLFQLPPLKEQKRIVEKVKELFLEIDKNKIGILNVKMQLKQYVQSLLKSAFEGKLTDNWRRTNDSDVESELEKIRIIKNKKKIDPKLICEIPENISKLHKIPTNWAWVRLGFLSELITKGASPKWQGVNYADNGILFITSENIHSGVILLKKPKYLEKKFNKIQKRSILQKGDILTNIVGASIGRTAIYDLDEDAANINQAVSLIRILNQVNTNYIQHILNSPLILNYMNVKKVDVARANLSLQNVADFPIPLPSRKEQKQIMTKLQHGLSLIKNVDDNVNFMLDQLDTLRSTILKQAFEGKLVPQDPNDEPASELLKKVQLKIEESKK